MLNKCGINVNIRITYQSKEKTDGKVSNLIKYINPNSN
jgi:hypothetical protein